MILFLLYYTLATLILVIVDRVRIRFATAQKRVNIRKWVSWSLGVVAGVGCWWIADTPVWLSCAAIAVGVRYAIYDPLLNLANGQKIDHQSTTTNSTTDQAENLIGLSFWAQRLIGVVLAGIPFFINWIKSIQ